MISHTFLQSPAPPARPGLEASVAQKPLRRPIPLDSGKASSMIAETPKRRQRSPGFCFLLPRLSLSAERAGRIRSTLKSPRFQQATLKHVPGSPPELEPRASLLLLLLLRLSCSCRLHPLPMKSLWRGRGKILPLPQRRQEGKNAVFSPRGRQSPLFCSQEQIAVRSPAGSPWFLPHQLHWCQALLRDAAREGNA